MGVPVVTCPGETFAGRHALTHLSNVGLTETIARDFDEYVELAVSLAENLQHLASLRAGLRERMAASALCDGNRFAGQLIEIVQTAWEQQAADFVQGDRASSESGRDSLPPAAQGTLQAGANAFQGERTK
jgi:predicted O-linked N-acetylglucosamine transferase (SPINDLY family)